MPCGSDVADVRTGDQKEGDGPPDDRGVAVGWRWRRGQALARELTIRQVTATSGTRRPAGASRRRDATVAVAVGILVALGWWLAVEPVAAQDAPEAAEEDLFVRGGEVYQANCAACHGTRAEGGEGQGVLGGPPLQDVDIAYVDLTVRTGRMPIPAPSVGVHADELGEADREAIVVYMTERFGLAGEIPTVRSGDPSRGQEVYVRNCAACHGAAASGGISGANVWVPPLVDLDGIAIVEATRIGPFEMPAFDAAVLSDAALDDIVGYLDLVAATPRTAAGVREVDQLTSGLFGLGLGLLATVVVLVVARARRWYPGDPEGFHTAPPFEPRADPGAEGDAGPAREIPAEPDA